MEHDWSTLALAMIGAFSLGVAKTGFPGLAILNVILLAELFGARQSAGIILPLLVVCDLLVYPAFRRYSSWKKALWPLLPPTLIGVAMGYLVLRHIDNATARPLIGWIVLFMLALQLLREWKGDWLAHLPNSLRFAWFSGGLIGIATTVANAAGPIFSIHSLVSHWPKEEFLGRGARFFLLVNVLKIPFLGHLDLVNAGSLMIDAILLPALLGGLVLGRFLIHRVRQRTFEVLLYLFSAVSGLYMVCGNAVITAIKSFAA
ncbi:MAG TPA: sulfite exporter TauE/SafE family protein [Verrucomicrobiales bacterium]|nr:sulfite exporter TauE/SafE family protein [Verrucomicrobiales bacterium]